MDRQTQKETTTMIWTTKNWKSVGAKLIGKDSGYLIWNYKGVEVYSQEVA